MPFTFASTVKRDVLDIVPKLIHIGSVILSRANYGRISMENLWRSREILLSWKEWENYIDAPFAIVTHRTYYYIALSLGSLGKCSLADGCGSGQR